MRCSQAAQVLVTGLLRQARENNDVSHSVVLTDILPVLADRMEPIDASCMYTKLSLDLASTLANKGEFPPGLSNWLAAIAKRLGPNELRAAGNPVLRVLSSAIEKEKTADARASLAWALAPLAERLGTRRRPPRFARPWLTDLVKSMQKAPDATARAALIGGLAALTLRLAPEQAIQTVRLLAARIESDRDCWNHLTTNDTLVQPIYILFSMLDASDAAKAAARLLVAALSQEKDTRNRLSLAAVLCCLAARMDAADAGKTCGPVIDDMAKAASCDKTGLRLLS